ncbi:MAG: ACP S-malonyltransferase [Candidatus Dormibacteria bacterium]
MTLYPTTVGAGLTAPVALLFPGQGVQRPGMGLELTRLFPEADRAISRAEEVLEMPVRRLCFEGPAEELLRTENIQPCLVAVSYAAFEAFKHRYGTGHIAVVAGHSLGEISACAASGAISWEDALLLVRERGRLMADAASTSPGRMLAIVGLAEEQVEAIRQQAGAAGGIWMANLNSPNQFILSGEAAAIAAAETLATTAKARRVVMLDIPLGAHSPLMSRAASKLAETVRALPLRAPQIPLIANGTGLVLHSVNAVRSELVGHLLRPVLWARTMAAMQRLRVATVVELGPGRVLASLAAKHMTGVVTWNADELLVDEQGL